jgi:hypothetical protein
MSLHLSGPALGQASRAPENTARRCSPLPRSPVTPDPHRSHSLLHQGRWALGPVAGEIFEVLEEGRDLLPQVALRRTTQGQLQRLMQTCPGPTSLCGSGQPLEGARGQGLAQARASKGAGSSAGFSSHPLPKHHGFLFCFWWDWGLNSGLHAATPPIHFALVIWEIGSWELLAWGWP